MSEAYIYDVVRTPRGKGKKDGKLSEVKAVKLVATVLQAIRERNQLDTREVEDVIMGCVTQTGDQGADVAKGGVIAAGYDNSVSGVTLNRFCGSGLEAVNQAAAQVMTGQTGLMIAGGVESMSRVPMGSDGGALFTDPEMIAKYNLVPQGISADLIATKWGITRDALDGFAVESHKRASTAWSENRFSRSIIPVRDINGSILLDRDEMVRPDCSLAGLAKLNPSFAMMGEMAGFDDLAIQKYPDVEKIEHRHHPGNSSAIVDGAAAVLIGDKEIGIRLGIKPRAKIKSFAVVGTEPTIMLIGPAPATVKALQRAKMVINDVNLFEVNEAFAAVPLQFMHELGVSPSKVNVNGGAIAMGHPLGATGAMLVGALLDELERTDQTVGVVTLCIGGGMGIATVIERC